MGWERVVDNQAHDRAAVDRIETGHISRKPVLLPQPVLGHAGAAEDHRRHLYLGLLTPNDPKQETDRDHA
jgi:hypothetical protein